MPGLAIGFLGHATVRVELAGRVVLTDPVLSWRLSVLSRVAPAPPPEGYADVDLVLVSHLHGEELAPGEELVDGPLRVTGAPAAHNGLRWGPRSTRGPRAVAMGHLIEADGVRVYAAGDTDLFPEMAGLAPADVALLPVWGWGPTLRGRLVEPPEEFAIAAAAAGHPAEVAVTPPGTQVPLPDLRRPR